MSHLPFLVSALLMAANGSKGKSTSSSGSIVPLLVIVVIIAGAYFLFLKPRQQKAREQKAKASQAGIGDEIVTVGGIVGRVVEMSDDRLTIVTGEDAGAAADGSQPHRMVILKQAVSRRVEPAPAPAAAADDDQWDDDEEYEEYDEYDEDEGDDGDEPSVEGTRR